MRKGFLLAAGLVLLCTWPVQAQYPPYYPNQQYPAYPPMAYPQYQGYAPQQQPPVLIGGTLQSSGQIALPSMRGKGPQTLPKYSPQQSINHKSMRPDLGQLPETIQEDVQGGGEVVIAPEDCPADPPVLYTAPKFSPQVEKHRPPRAPKGYKFYGSGEYVFWWTSTPDMPALLNIGPVASPTQTINGDSAPFDDNTSSGFRTTLGMWLDQDQTWAVEGNFFYLGDQLSKNNYISTGSTTFSRPFRTLTGAPSAIVIAGPGVGNANFEVESNLNLWNSEMNLRKELMRGTWWHVDLLAGYRHLSMDQHLRIADIRTVGTTSRTVLVDYFGTENRFNGGQLGVETELKYGRFFVDLWGKCAVGNNAQTVNIYGSTDLIPAPKVNNRNTYPGGLLALPSNMGEYTRNEFAVIPEVGLKAGMQLTHNLRVSGGYTIVYIDSAAQPGNQIDPVINATRVPSLNPAGAQVGANRPNFVFRDDDFWIQGVSLELEFRY